MSTEANLFRLHNVVSKVIDSHRLEITRALAATGFESEVKMVPDREIQITISRGDHRVTRFSVSLLPGCRHVMIFHGVVVEPAWRLMGIGSLLHRLRLQMAQAMDCSTAICTVLSGNSVEKNILTRHGWSRTVSVTPGIELWSKELSTSSSH